MNTWKVILATLVIFGTGVVTGGLLVTHSERVKQRQLWMQNRFEKNRPPRPDGREPGLPPGGVSNPGVEPDGRPPFGLPSRLRLDLLERIERNIEITPGQREKIEEILREGQDRTRQIMEPVQPELQRQMRTTHERIREVLTDEQQRRFDQLMRPQRRGEEQPPSDRRMQRQPRPQDGHPRLPPPGPRPAEPPNPDQ